MSPFESQAASALCRADAERLQRCTPRHRWRPRGLTVLVTQRGEGLTHFTATREGRTVPQLGVCLQPRSK